MSKRQHSPAPGLPAKRLYTDAGLSRSPASKSGFDAVLYDEIILVIFSYLSWSDLCAIQPTSRNWSRLSLDNQLWKGLYLSEYGRSRLRGVRGFIGRADGREIRPLPGRAKADDIKDWKWMFRISSNWRTGRCSVEHVPTELQETHPEPQAHVSHDDPATIPHTFVLLAGSVTITASSHPSTHPVITLTSPNHASYMLSCPFVRSNGARVEITSLALDQSQPTTQERHHVRLVCFLSTGEYSLFQINHCTPSSSHHLGTYTPSSGIPAARVTPIVQSVYHHPLLVTLSQSFHLSLYDLSDHSHIRHSQTLTSYTSYPPTSFILSAPTLSTYKLVLAYAIPVYPAHWSVGATELIIHNDHNGSSSSPPLTGNTRTMAVANTRSTKAFDIPLGWIDEQKLKAVKEQWTRKVAKVADAQTDGKWVILAPGDPFSPTTTSSQHVSTSLQLYRLHLPAGVSSSAVPRMSFVRTLHGHMGPVSAVAVADGRCVSLGTNGSIWVWDLEGGTGAEVTSGQFKPEHTRAAGGAAREGRKGTVVFDERRIISADARGLEVRRFDV